MRILWDTDPTSVERYQFALGEMQRFDNIAFVERALHDNPNVSLVAIGPDIDLDEACSLAESLRINRAELSIILLRSRLDVTAMGQALRSGIREVVPAGDHEALTEAVRRCAELWTKLTGQSAGGGVKHGKIVTVFSPKGGVGKTMLSTNLAVHLARKGVRTCIVDLDLASGDVGISLQIIPERTISDVLSMQGQIDTQAISAIATMHPASGLDVICAPADPADADRIPVNVVQQLLRAATEVYDFVVVDTPPEFTEHVLAACDVSDELILIATLDIPSVKNLRIALDTLDMLGNPEESRLIVLNKADLKVGLKPEDVRAALKREVAVSIPSSLHVPSSVNRGVPVILDDPKSPVSAAIREIGDNHVHGRFGGGAGSRVESRRRGGRRTIRGAR